MLDAQTLTAFIVSGVSLAYSIFMLLFLNNAEKCDKHLSKRDTQFRKTAVIVTWVSIVVTSLSVLGLLVALLSGTKTYEMLPPMAFD
jgi:hypothetical protein